MPKCPACDLDIKLPTEVEATEVALVELAQLHLLKHILETLRTVVEEVRGVSRTI